MNHKDLLLLAASLTFMMSLVGCGRSPTEPIATPTPTIKSIFPTGMFTAKDRDWVITFNDDGSFTSGFGEIAVSGTFSIQANELTWETDSFCDRRATYTWTFEDDTLLFQVKGEDKCSSRLRVLDNVPYYKEQ